MILFRKVSGQEGECPQADVPCVGAHIGQPKVTQTKSGVMCDDPWGGGGRLTSFRLAGSVPPAALGSCQLSLSSQHPSVSSVWRSGGEGIRPDRRFRQVQGCWSPLSSFPLGCFPFSASCVTHSAGAFSGGHLLAMQACTYPGGSGISWAWFPE